MALINKFQFRPAEWLPFQDAEMLNRISLSNIRDYEGKKYENPEFELRIVWDVHNYFAVDLFQRIRLSDVQNKKLVLILPSPENAVFISVVENLNKYQISCRNAVSYTQLRAHET